MRLTQIAPNWDEGQWIRLFGCLVANTSVPVHHPWTKWKRTRYFEVYNVSDTRARAHTFELTTRRKKKKKREQQKNKKKNDNKNLILIKMNWPTHRNVSFHYSNTPLQKLHLNSRTPSVNLYMLTAIILYNVIWLFLDPHPHLLSVKFEATCFCISFESMAVHSAILHQWFDSLTWQCWVYGQCLFLLYWIHATAKTVTENIHISSIYT